MSYQRTRAIVIIVAALALMRLAEALLREPVARDQGRGGGGW